MANTVEEVPGHGGHTVVRLTRSSGASCEIYVYAAHVTSWKTGDSIERLYLSSATEYDTGKAIRGGIPICWPQFSGRGPYPKHGFVRTTDSWKVRRCVSEPHPSVTLELRDCEGAKDFPFDFVLTYTVTLDSNSSIKINMQVLNQSDEPMEFNTALHTYFTVTDVTKVKVVGLQGLKFEDNTRGLQVFEDEEEQLLVNGELDRVYLNAPDELLIFDQSTSISIQKHGFPDAVVWNIGEEKAPSIKDMAAGDWQRYICLEAGAIGEKIVVKPCESWAAEQKLCVSTAVAAKIADLGEPVAGMTDDSEKLERVEKAFKKLKKPAVTMDEAYSIMFSSEEKSVYNYNDFLEDLKSFADNMKNPDEISWDEIKLFYETVG